MSLGSEYIADHEFERDYPFGLPNDYWYSRRGKILLKDMSTGHILACMNLVGEDDAWYYKFLEELKKRQ